MTFAPDTVEALESSVHLANSALAPDTLTTIESNNALFNDSLDAMDKKLADKAVQQEARMREQNKHFAEVCAGMEAKSEDRAKEVQQHCTRACTETDLRQEEQRKEFKAWMEEASKTMEEHHQHFTAVCTKLDMQLAEEAETLQDLAGGKIGIAGTEATRP